MKKIYYEKKVSKTGYVKYIPVAEYDNDYLDSFPKGTHLVICNPGNTSRKFNIDPDYAGLIAASEVAQDAMCKAVIKASELRPSRTPITPAQKRAWKKLAKEFGSELCTLSGTSSHDIAEAGIKALQKEANVLYSNPAVKKAYDNFILVCKLTKEQQ